MLNYDDFKKAVKKKFLDYMPAEYRGMELKIFKSTKINQTVDGLTLINAGTMPVINVDNLYEYYMKNGSLDAVLKAAANVMCENMEKRIKVDLEELKNNIIFQVINTEQNRALLKEIPHREFLDLSIIYRWVVGMNKEEILSSIIKNDFAKSYNLSEEEMYRLATENTRRIMPPVVESIIDAVRKHCGENEIVDMMLEAMEILPSTQEIWVISNTREIDGASSILYDSILSELAEKIESNFYIIPSSIHEVIAIAVPYVQNPNVLSDMVHEINMEEVKINERLSNQVYRYDRKTHQLTMVTNTISKRLV